MLFNNRTLKLLTIQEQKSGAVIMKLLHNQNISSNYGTLAKPSNGESPQRLDPVFYGRMGHKEFGEPVGFLFALERVGDK